MKSRLGWALLVLLGTGVIAGGCGGEGKECGEGTVAMGDRCVPESEVTCGAGTMLDMEVCVPSEEPVTCGTGTTLNTATGECEPDVTCAPGTVAMSGRCVPDGSVICTGNTTYDASTGTCVLDESACAEGTVLVDGACVPFDDSLVADVHAAAEPDSGAYDGTGATFTPPAIGSTVTLDGCITPADFDEDGVIDVDEDVFDFTVSAPGYYDMRIDGLNGLSAAFVVFSPDDLLAGWQRVGLDLTSDGAQRRVWLPRAGQYGIVVTDSRSLLTGAPAGSENTCYFMSIEALATPTPTPLTEDSRMGTLGDPQFFSVEASSDTVFRVQLDADDPAAVPAFALAQGTTFDGHASDDTSAVQFSGTVTDGNALTIVVDHVYDYAIAPVSYELSLIRALRAEGTVPVTHVDNTYSFLFFEGTAGDIVQFGYTAADPIAMLVFGADGALASDTCEPGYECDENTDWLQLTQTGRNVVLLYNPSGTDGMPYDVTFTRQAYTPTALTSDTSATITLAGGYGFATIDASSVEWGRIGLANLAGTGFTTANLAVFSRDSAGALALPGAYGIVSAIESATTATGMSRIWLPTSPGQILIAVRDSSGTFDGDETVDVTFGPEVYEPIMLVTGTPETRDGVAIAADSRKLYLVRAETGSDVTITATGQGGADVVISRLDRTATVLDDIDDTGADQAEEMTVAMGASGWLAFAIDLGPAGGTVDVAFEAAPPPYSVMTSTRTFVDACASGTEIVNSDDALSSVHTLTAFTSFDYFGAPVTAFRASTNGWMTFDSSYTGSSWMPTLPSASDPNRVVAPYARDLVARVCVLESASQLIVQWTGQTWSGSQPVEMQAIFVAGTNEIHFVYGSGHMATTSGTTGIENADGTFALIENARVMTNSAFRFVPN